MLQQTASLRDVFEPATETPSDARPEFTKPDWWEHATSPKYVGKLQAMLRLFFTGELTRPMLVRDANGKHVYSSRNFTGPCSGCYETEDGHPVGEYQYDAKAGCPKGSGCHECGYTGKRRTYFDPDELETGMSCDADATKKEDT